MTRTLVIEKPILNSAFEEPSRHYRFDEEGITDEILPGRRSSENVIPVPPPARRSKEMLLDADWIPHERKENRLVNDIRREVGSWRRGGYQAPAPLTEVTRTLLAYWREPRREKKLFFCQIEALETAIYLTEVAPFLPKGKAFLETLQKENEAHSPDLLRWAFKMATGSGKTVVMAMLIAWQTLNWAAQEETRPLRAKTKPGPRPENEGAAPLGLWEDDDTKKRRKARKENGLRFCKNFLIVAPGITIRDRLDVLRPTATGNYYKERDLLPPGQEELLSQAEIQIVNYHAFQCRSLEPDANDKHKTLLGNNFLETPIAMAQRICRGFDMKRSDILVINDEAHHCYRSRPEEEPSERKGDEKKEAESNQAEAKRWISGLESISRFQAKETKKRLRVYDLSATPYFLKGSGYPEAMLFPWVISDFPLVEAIEAGIVKVPRLPVGDDSHTGGMPTYRELWKHIKDDLPKKSPIQDEGEPSLPKELQGALEALYASYEGYFQRWEVSRKEAKDRALRENKPIPELSPPVFIVVCNNTTVSKRVFRYIAGWEKTFGPQTETEVSKDAPAPSSDPTALPSDPQAPPTPSAALPAKKGRKKSSEQRPQGKVVVQAGHLDLFRNDNGRGGWEGQPRTILVDSRQLESGEEMSAEFRALCERELREFKEEYKKRTNLEADTLKEQDLMREVLNTVGKPGKLGAEVRCVVSVSMLTEGWDVSSVTHILGVRAFTTQLLCEQVVGRALRRMSRVLDEQGLFETEYAEVFGVPFAFIPTSGSTTKPVPSKPFFRVRALPERSSLEISFPRLLGYHYELQAEELQAVFSREHLLTLSPKNFPLQTEVAGILGRSETTSLDRLKAKRENSIAWMIARELLSKFPDPEGQSKPWLFPQLLEITKAWLRDCLRLEDHAFLQLLALPAYKSLAVERIHAAISLASADQRTLRPVLHPSPWGSTAAVSFETAREVCVTYKSHVSHTVLDSRWEAVLEQRLEQMPEVLSYVKNDHLGFCIPYTFENKDRGYFPDFVAVIDDGKGEEDPLHLILEVTGYPSLEKDAKVRTARCLWLPAVNQHGEFGRWGFLEITEPHQAEALIRAFLKGQAKQKGSLPLAQGVETPEEAQIRAWVREDLEGKVFSALRLADVTTFTAAGLLEVLRYVAARGAAGLGRSLAHVGMQLYPALSDFAGYAEVLSPAKFLGTSPATGDFSKSRRWLKEHAHEYQGQWIAVKEGDLLGAGASLDSLLSDVGQEAYDQKTLVTKVVF